MLKFVYEKKKENDFFFEKKDENLISRSISLLKEILNNSSNPNAYITLYNILFQIKENNEYEEIMKSMNEYIKEKINMNKMNIDSKNLKESISHLYNLIKLIETICQKLKNLLTTPKTRFNPKIFELFNKYINQKDFISLLNISDINYFENDFLNLNENNREELLKFIKLIKSIGHKEKLKEIVSYLINIEDKKLQEISNKYNIFEVNDLMLYFNNLNEQIQESVNLFKILFGEQEANQLNEDFIQKYFLNKLSNNLFTNEQFFEVILSQKDYTILKKVEQISRRKNNSMNVFFQVFFNSYYNYFTKKITTPHDYNIKEGINYINQLYFFIEKLINIFKEVFHYSKQANFKYRETFIKMINYRLIKNFEFIFAIFTSEILYSQDSTKLFEEPFEIILSNLNGKSIFLNYTVKFMLKRISNFKFDINLEEKLEERLRKIVEIKYMIKCTRLIKDIKENSSIYNLKENIFFYLFSFDTLSKDEINQILIMDNQIIKNPFNENLNLYYEQYPKRQVYISQSLSICQIEFLGKYDLYVNYIQACILINFNKKKCLSYKELKDLLPHESKFSIILRAYILSLINLNILIKENPENKDLINEDIIKVNFSFSYENKRINCFEKTNSEISKIGNISIKGDSKKEVILNNESIYKANKHFIIDSKIIKYVKSCKEKRILENELIRNILLDDYIKDLFKDEIEVIYVKDRILNLLNRELISSEKENGKVYYKH